MTIYLFAYGSLINTKYNKEITNIFFKKHTPVNVHHLKRFWMKPFKISDENYLAIMDNINSITNGILIEVNQDDLDRLDKREKYYTRKVLDKNRISFDYNVTNLTNLTNFLSDQDIVYTYYCNSNAIQIDFDKYNSETKKYLLECLEGCISFGKDFFNNFIFMTEFKIIQ